MLKNAEEVWRFPRTWVSRVLFCCALYWIYDVLTYSFLFIDLVKVKYLRIRDLHKVEIESAKLWQNLRLLAGKSFNVMILLCNFIQLWVFNDFIPFWKFSTKRKSTIYKVDVKFYCLLGLKITLYIPDNIKAHGTLLLIEKILFKNIITQVTHL